MSTESHIDAAVLADYWLGILSDPEGEAIEEHLLECDACGARLREVIAVAEGIRNVARGGALRMVVSDAFLESLSGEGARIRQYTVPAGASVQCTVTAGDDLLIGRLGANISGGKRVDLCFYDERGVEQVRLMDIPVPLGQGSVIYQESITFAKAAPDSMMTARLLSFDEAGGESVLGEYTFHHTRSLPGPGLQR